MASRPVPEPGSRSIVGLDLRPLLESGADPLERVLASLEELPPDGVLKLTAPARPASLLSRLEERGCRARPQRVARRLWSVEVQLPGAPEIADFRDLPAPEPLERILEATARLAPGEAFLARTPFHPRLLLPHLERRGLRFEVFDEPDETALIHVRRPS